MAKKRKRKSTPNLPEAALEHARRQVEGEDEDGQESSAEQKRAERAARRAERRARAARARDSIRAGNPSVEASNATATSRRKSDKLDNETIQQLLANPTRIVSEEQLHEDYGHVVADIRNMFILAVLLMIVLIAMAQFI